MKILEQLEPSRVQQRAQHAALHRFHAVQVSRAAEQLQQDGFGLVVPRVAGDDGIGLNPFGRAHQKPVAQTPRRVFDVPPLRGGDAGNFGALGMEG